MLLGRKAIGTVAFMGGLPATLTNFTTSWGKMIACCYEQLITNETQYLHLDEASFSDHGPARNSLVGKFLGDWLIQFDTDHEFEPDIVCRLLRLANKYEVDVISALYQFKHPPHVPVLFAHRKITEEKEVLEPIASWSKEATLLRISSAGAGCLFVRRSVFNRIVNELKEQPFDKIGSNSEDHSFFIRCRKLEIPCYAAMKVHCNHLRPKAVTLDDYDPTQIQISQDIPVGGYS